MHPRTANEPACVQKQEGSGSSLGVWAGLGAEMGSAASPHCVSLVGGSEHPVGRKRGRIVWPQAEIQATVPQRGMEGSPEVPAHCSAQPGYGNVQQEPSGQLRASPCVPARITACNSDRNRDPAAPTSCLLPGLPVLVGKPFLTPGDKQVEPWSMAFDAHLQNSTVASSVTPARGSPWPQPVSTSCWDQLGGLGFNYGLTMGLTMLTAREVG